MNITDAVEAMLDEQRHIMIVGFEPASEPYEPRPVPEEDGDFSGADTGGEGDR